MGFAGVIRFNYLRNAPPGFNRAVEELPQALHVPLVSILAALLIVGCAWGIEGVRIRNARLAEQSAQVRVEQSRQALQRAALVQMDVQAMVTLDRDVRSIRRSGYVVAYRIADIGNRLPSQAWLTSISRTQDGISIDGHALGLRALADSMNRLMVSGAVSAPELIRAAHENSAAAGADQLSFELRLQERQP